MNALSQIGKQISELFAAMTPQARIMAGLMVGVIVVSLGWIMSVSGGSNLEPLLGASFTNIELRRMESAFGEAGLSGYERIGQQIRIPKGEKDLYLKALTASNAMPEEWGSKVSAALNEGSVFDSPLKQQMRFKTAKEQELATLLEGIQGIEEAAVQYDEKKSGFMRERDAACAVWIRAPLGQKVSTEMRRSIAKQTMRTFAGLTENDISVLDMTSGEIYDMSSDAMSESPYLTEQIRYEEKLKRQINDFLGNKYGDVQLMVSVELDPTLQQTSEELTYDSPVTLRSSTSRKDTENEKSPPSGPPGLAPEQRQAVANSAAQLSGSSSSQMSSSKESTEDTDNTAGHTAVVKSTAGLVPTRVTVNLSVPQSHIRKVWQHQQLLAAPDTKAEELEPPTEVQLAPLEDKITSQLQAALEALPVGLRGGQSPVPYVTVTTYADTPVAPLPEPSMMSGVLAWLADSWSTLGLFAVLLIGLAMMSSWIKSVGDNDADEKFADAFGLKIPDTIYDEIDVGAETDPAAAEAGDGNRNVAFDVTGADMKEDVSTLIKENPDAAVNLLKTWIGDAA